MPGRGADWERGDHAHARPRPFSRIRSRRRAAASRRTLVVLVVAGLLGLAGCAAQQQTVSATESSHPRSPSPVLTSSPKPSGPLPGLLLIADRGNDRLLLVDGRKRTVWRYPPRGTRPSFPFRYPDDAFFVPGYRGIVSNQEDQDTIQVVSFPGGRVVWHYGHPGVPGSSRGYLDRPDDAYVLPDGMRTVADILNCRVLTISPAGTVVRRYGTTGVCGHAPPRVLGSPNGDTPLPGGGMLVTEISGSWVDAIGADGRLQWTVHTPAAYPSDAQPLSGGRILLADYSSPGRLFVVHRSGRLLWRYGPSSGPGALDHPSLAVMLPNGLIAVSDDYRDRVVLIDPHTKRIVWQYGHTDAAGRGTGFLNTPDGLDFLPADALGAAGIRGPVLP